MKKILSYFLPIQLRKYQTHNNGMLTINLLNGRKVLDTAVANYSYGALQKALKQALKKLPFSESMQHVLVLGMGGGSVAATIRQDFHSAASITMVEIDPVLIRIAEDEFSLAELGNIHIVHDDAAVFVKNDPARYDLIIVDLFIIDTIPEIFTQEAFLVQLSGKLSPGAALVFNTIRDTLDPGVLKKMVSALNNCAVTTRIMKKLFGTNDIILGRKTTNQTAA